MPIPSLSIHGLLPAGVYDCTVQEIEDTFGWNEHRKHLLDRFKDCLENKIRSRFPEEPVYFDGSFVTDKEDPGDIDIVLEMQHSS